MARSDTMRARELSIDPVQCLALRVTYVGELGWELSPYQARGGIRREAGKGDFIGRDALLAARDRAGGEQLRCLVLEDPRSVALGEEPVRVDGRIVGRVTSGGFGYTVERSIAYAYLPAENGEPGSGAEVEIFGRWVSATVAQEPPLDPEGRRVRS